MIDTVFYYVDSFDEYDYRQKVGEIAPHTIVFVGDIKSIYKDGDCYSIGDDEKIKEIIKETFIGDESPLPIATREKLGGIIVGDILKIEDDGTLSVDPKSLIQAIIADPEILDILNAQLLKVEGLHGKDGATPEIMNGEWYINGLSTGVRAEGLTGPQGPQGPAGKDGVTPTIEIKSLNGVGYWFINGQNTNVIAEGRNGVDGKDGKDGKDGSSGSSGSNSGNGSGSSTGSDIQNILDDLSDLKDEWDDLDKRIEDEVKDLFEDWSFVKTNLFDKLDENQIGSISNFGLQDVKDYLLLIGVWQEEDGKIKYRWSEICQKVDEISLTVSQLTALENGDFTALESWMKGYIDTELGKVTNSLGTMWARKSAEKILEYMYSGLIQSSDENITYNELESTGKSNILSAFAGIRTAVERTSDDSDYFIAKTSLSAAIKDAKDEIVSAAMTTLEADMTHAEGSLFAYLEGRYAGIRNVVTKDPETGEISSGVTISGDIINFDSGKSKFKGEVEATKFLAGDRSDLNITIEGRNDDENLPALGFSKICFNCANDCRAFFTSEGLGMQLYIKDANGAWKKIDFTQGIFVNTTITGTTNHVDLYSLTSNGQMEYVRSVYYNTYGTFYSDQAGQTYASTLWNNYYIKENKPNVIVSRAVGGNSTATRTELYDCNVYTKVLFGQLGSMTLTKNKRIQIAGTNIWLTSYRDTDEIDINAQNIYFGTSNTTVSNIHPNANEQFRVKRMIYGTTQTGEFNMKVYGIRDTGQVVNQGGNIKNIFAVYTFE